MKQRGTVPKRDLVGILQVLLQTGRLKVAGRLKLRLVLSQEMHAEKGGYDAIATISYTIAP